MKKPAVILLTVLAGAIIATGCAHLTSAERYARKYVYASGEIFNPGFRLNRMASSQLMVPFFQQFWALGVKDRATGLSREQALQRACYYSSEAFINTIPSSQKYAGQTYNNNVPLSPKGLKSLQDGIIATYIDGYDGNR